MDMHDEEIQARFLSGVDAVLQVLTAAIARLEQAKIAGKANRPMEAFGHYKAVMTELESLVNLTRETR